jgi:hypothetical protein
VRQVRRMRNGGQGRSDIEGRVGGLDWIGESLE